MDPVIVKLTGDPLFWGAIMGVFGVVLGHWVTRKGTREEHQLTVLKVTVESLQSSYDVIREDYITLKQEVETLRKEVEDAHRRSREVQEKYSSALSHAAALRIAGITLFGRLDRDLYDHAELPPVPDLIERDMRHDWPSAFKDHYDYLTTGKPDV